MYFGCSSVQLRISPSAVRSKERDSATLCLCIQQKRSTRIFVCSCWFGRSWCSQQHMIQVTFQTGMISTAASSFKGALLIRDWSTLLSHKWLPAGSQHKRDVGKAFVFCVSLSHLSTLFLKTSSHLKIGKGLTVSQRAGRFMNWRESESPDQGSSVHLLKH